ncbi:MAG: hypothetical protein K2Q03_01055 [Sphingobacteriaceae bacterium]|nr:hypothetical protein [Sphingobacteriaceae bacterium]
MDREELMGNNPERQDVNQAPKASPLLSLEKDLKLYTDAIKEVSTDIIAEGLSQIPIFIAHQHEISIGEVILNRDELNTSWTIHVSTLEEFISKGIIHPDKKENFVKNYKNPQKFMCIFVVVPEGANFVFYPYEISN